MKRFVTYLILCLLLVVPVTQAQTVAYGTTNSSIPAPSVQAAVDSAGDGDYIFISTGTFYETVIVSNKHLRFQGGYTDPPTNYAGGYTAIDAGGAGTPLWFIQSRTSFVHDISLVNGSGEAVNFWSGGGCLLHESTVEFTDTSFCSNNAWNGGGFFVGLYSHAKLDGASRVFSNFAYFAGGGIYVDGSCHIVHEDADVFDNTAIDSTGGGIQLSSASMRILQADVFDNIAVSGAVNGASGGGGIYCEGSFLEIGDGAEIKHNKADFGAGILPANSTVTLGRARADDVSIIDNVASISGGGMYALLSDLSCSGTLWQGNTAGWDAGGGYAWGSRLSGDTNKVTFTSNTAGRSGGGLYLTRSTSTFEVAVFGTDTNSGNEAADHGGGLVLRDSRTSIKGGLFAGNRVTNPSNGYGGALSCENSTLLLTNGAGSFGDYTQVSFTSNSAVFGGALYLSNSTFNAYDCDLGENTAVTNGGAAFSIASGPSWHNCRFSHNTAGDSGGALYCSGGDQVFVFDGAFLYNKASQGGAIYIIDGVQLGIFGQEEPFYLPPDDWAVLFYGNKATGGGALSTYNTPTMIQETAFLCNTGHFSILSIGGTYALSSLSLPHIYMAHSLVAENFESGGQGIFNIDLNATGTLFGCTIASNDGSGIVVGSVGSQSSLAVSNSVLWGNTSAAINNSILTIDHSNVQGGWAGSGNINSNPVFFSNYHLQYASPCRNAGSPAGGSDYDIDGELRSGNIDMGCDEFVDGDSDHLPDIVETGTGIYNSDIDTGSDNGNPNSDGDAVDDGEEWLADTNPNDSNHYFRVDNIWLPAGQPAPWFSVTYGSNAYLEIDFTTDSTTNDWLHSLTVSPSAYTNEFALTPGDISFIRLRAHR